jgi:glycosyltransferase involved in cell wall biosynthesis
MSLLRDMRIIYFAPVDYDSIKQRPQHFADRLSTCYDFVYIQPCGLRSLKFSDFHRVVSRARQLFAVPVNTENRVRVKSLVFVPFANSVFDRLNSNLIKMQVRKFITSDTVFWFTAPSAVLLPLLEEFPSVPVIYEMMDDYGMIQPRRRPIIDRNENRMLQRADRVMVTSANLLAKAMKYVPPERCFQIGNGVDIGKFHKSDYAQLPENCFKNGRKIIGYIGAIEWWLDYDLINAIAANYPRCNVVFVGPVRYDKIPVRDNLFFLGKRPFESVPDYCNAFDVCLIPFKPGEFADTINPVKLYEYFALGKPVVSYIMKELLQYRDGLYLADSQKSFVDQIALALGEKDADKARRRREIAAANSWDSKLKMAREVLASLSDTVPDPQRLRNANVYQHN